jgi:hypothetical protein
VSARRQPSEVGGATAGHVVGQVGELVQPAQHLKRKWENKMGGGRMVD